MSQEAMSRLAQQSQNGRAKSSQFASAPAAEAKVAPRFAFAYRFDPSGYLESEQTAAIARLIVMNAELERIEAQELAEKVTVSVANSQGPECLAFASVRMSTCGNDRTY